MKTEIPEWIRNPQLSLTIAVIGAGGSGSMFLQHLARLVYAYQELYNRRVSVIVADGDKVDKTNIGRQAFGMNELGYFKSELIVSRINRFYGFDWIAVPDYFHYIKKNNDNFMIYASTFIISAVDSVKVKEDIKSFFLEGQQIKNNPEYFPYFWIDMGNTKTTGNVIVASHILEWPDIFTYRDSFSKDTDEGPSCTLAMALNKQDLFINSQCALAAAKWLWECLNNVEMNWRGAFINLDTFAIHKLKIISAHVTTQRADIAQPAKSVIRKSGSSKNSVKSIKKRKSKNSIAK